ncbi:Rap1a/Tai family immunity protein [Rhizobium mongolense]|uniref:Rap1a immunity protein domain-containing protein n=2 Tax=Rhizobium mongolense TaxID=57676 RepID=A0A559SLF3_9HYPH|nr:Rap1a/Tai family immunity protein [Rhizobium mongolense]TVZ63190.1 hypothetical protein BCL32_3313 [Rhizobium mongolense USDA 1844]
MQISLLIATMFVATVSSKLPEGFSMGGTLYVDCLSSREFVRGYVTGWLEKWGRDEYLARRNLETPPFRAERMVDGAYFGQSVGMNFCLPANVSAKEIADDLCRFLKANPAAHDAAGDDLMMVWMKGRFECNGR